MKFENSVIRCSRCGAATPIEDGYYVGSDLIMGALARATPEQLERLLGIATKLRDRQISLDAAANEADATGQWNAIFAHLNRVGGLPLLIALSTC